MALGVPAEPPDLVLAVGRGGVSVQDPVALGQAQPAHAADAGEGLLTFQSIEYSLFSSFREWTSTGIMEHFDIIC